ncbi:glycosyltransferase family 92 protein At1g27200-like [Lolium rigidum]|uniref:glycosyltransferase family 92 protein At1g27200-like n=1 Tax=Lolium rigidum TaxID=89674 RepID=UPI001F5CAC59|nr:glycosyltransferase family 92 protein At1g27200-like [Lolium rigidum]
MPKHPRPSRLRRILTAAGAATVAGLVLFSGRQAVLSKAPVFSPGLFPGGLAVESWPMPQELLRPPTFLFPHPSEADIDFALPRRLLPLRPHSQPQHDADAVFLPDESDAAVFPDSDAVLLPDSEVLVLADEPVDDAICAFQGGASSPARSLGTLPGPGRHAYLCAMPETEQTIQPLQAPLLLSASSSADSPAAAPADLPVRPMLNWRNRLVFDSAVLDGGDVLVFAKGVIRRQWANTANPPVQCVYHGRDDGASASLPAITAAQQVARCPPPPALLTSSNTQLRVTLSVTGEEPIPSLAIYRPQQSDLAAVAPPTRNNICACTMVRNVSKFLREWVLYHDALGVGQFFLYDNGSEDNLAGKVADLRSTGVNISTVAWPWTKTQEAGLSHCAAVHQASCQWMAFVDVDEFIFSPDWKNLESPSKSMLEALVSVDPQIGQIYLPCFDFGPSGQTAHPQEGVCQGYTCRLKTQQRHKSFVRLDAVEPSLQNSVHHFSLRSGFTNMWTRLARINHYKYQAWTEFKLKFKRRVSAYVADWTDPVNLKSSDRAPGLGVEAVEPPGWADKFCEVKDTVMQELSVRWFGTGFGGHGSSKSKGSHETHTGDVALSPSLP